MNDGKLAGTGGIECGVSRGRIGKIVSLILLTFLTVGFLEAEDRFQLEDRDVVVFLGGGNLIRAQREGYLELGLSHAFSEQKPRFRDLAWEGDTVFHQTTVRERWRREAFGDLSSQLKRVGATVVVMQFGQMEALDGVEGVERFSDGYEKLLGEVRKQTQRIILVSPTPFGKTQQAQLPDLTARNSELRNYARAVKKLAEAGGHTYVDLVDPMLERFGDGDMTQDGYQLATNAHRPVAEAILNQLGVVDVPWSSLASTRLAVIEKHRLWYEYWRPANWKCLFGDDSRRIFSIGGKGLPTFKDEWNRYPGLIEQAEDQVWAVMKGAPFVPPVPAKPEPGPKNVLSPGEAAKTFETIPGFTVNLFGSELDGVLNPLSMRWDGKGRMYVACTMVYPQIVPGAAPNDTIVLLEDTDQDGKADKSTVFADGLNIPTGMEVGANGVYVGQGTELLLLQDTDGDDKADTRTVLLSGLGNGDSHQTANCFVWSPGGELFFCQGDGIESRVETPHGVSSLYQAGVFRLRPGELELHGLLDDFMGPGNPWGVVFDNYGQSFVVDGAGGISYLTPAHLPVQHRLRLPRIGKPGGYCGVEMIGTPVLPDDLQGDFLLGDYKRNRISRYRVEPDGAGFKVVWKDPLVQSSDRNFRPVDVKVGPDGAVYVADWYNPVTCHQDDFYRHPDRDELRGRIWRVAPTAGWRKEKLDLTSENVAQLASRLGSTDRWILQATKRELQRRDKRKVEAALKREVIRWEKDRAGKPGYERGLVEILGAFEWVDGFAPGLVARLLDAEDHRARGYATRVVGRWHRKFDAPLTLLARMVADPHPQVRMEAVLACGGIPDPRSVEIVARTVDHTSDRWIDYAVVQAIQHLKDQWVPAFRRGELDFGGNSRHLAMVLERAKLGELTSQLFELARREELSGEERVSILRGVLAVGGAEDLRRLLDPETFRFKRQLGPNEFGGGVRYDMDSLATLLDELPDAMGRRGVRPEGDLEKPLRHLIRISNDRLRASAVKLAGVLGVDGLLPDVVGIACSAGESKSLRVAALRATGELGDLEEAAVLFGLTLKGHPDFVRTEAVKSLGRVQPALASDLVVEWIVNRESGKGALVDAHLGRKGGGTELLRALAAVELSEADASWLLQRLESTGRLESVLMGYLKERVGVNEIPEYSMERVKQLVQSSLSDGDAARGEDVFRSGVGNCYSCHQVAGVGGWLGPDLSSIGSAIPLERIVEELVWPRRAVKEGFALMQVTTRQGDVIQGYEQKHKNQDKTLLLTDFATREQREISRGLVESSENLGSAMPESAVAGLSPRQLKDLIRFLSVVGVDGRFSASSGQALRSWDLLMESPDNPDIPELLEDGDWMPVYSRLSGQMLKADFGEAESVYLRTPVREPAGDQRLKFPGVEGVRVWLGGTEVRARAGGRFELEGAGTADWIVVQIPLKDAPQVFGAEWGD